MQLLSLGSAVSGNLRGIFLENVSLSGAPTDGDRAPLR